MKKILNKLFRLKYEIDVPIEETPPTPTPQPPTEEEIYLKKRIDSLEQELYHYLYKNQHINYSISYELTDSSNYEIIVFDFKLRLELSFKINLIENDANDVIEYIKYVYKFKHNINLDEEQTLSHWEWDYIKKEKEYMYQTRMRPQFKQM